MAEGWIARFQIEVPGPCLQVHLRMSGPVRRSPGDGGSTAQLGHQCALVAGRRPAKLLYADSEVLATAPCLAPHGYGGPSWGQCEFKSGACERGSQLMGCSRNRGCRPRHLFIAFSLYLKKKKGKPSGQLQECYSEGLYVFPTSSS